MSRIVIRKLHTDGFSHFRAEIVWDPSDPTVEQVNRNFDVPNGGIASVTVTPNSSEPEYITVKIFPEDVPDMDVFSLALKLTDPLPASFDGARLPTLHFPEPYLLKALSDAPNGFSVSTGNSSNSKS